MQAELEDLSHSVVVQEATKTELCELHKVAAGKLAEVEEASLKEKESLQRALDEAKDQFFLPWH